MKRIVTFQDLIRVMKTIEASIKGNDKREQLFDKLRVGVRKEADSHRIQKLSGIFESKKVPRPITLLYLDLKNACAESPEIEFPDI